jgi:hypothetical protein
MFGKLEIFHPNILENSLNWPISTRKPIKKKKYTFIKRAQAIVVPIFQHILLLDDIKETKQTHKCFQLQKQQDNILMGKIFVKTVGLLQLLLLHTNRSIISVKNMLSHQLKLFHLD